MNNETGNNKSTSKINLFENKKDCCGCGACMNVCPKQAISMQEDEYGFLYPVIDDSLCVKCGCCKRACGYQNIIESASPIATYASSNNNDDQILKSASGGMFAAFAEKILKVGGIAFGASMETIDGKLTPMHLGITEENDLIKLQGSKYVQSYIGKTYSEAKNYLISGRMVLFSGTPCQIAGLKAFLKNDYENLLTVDIVCHGVPSTRFFQDYITVLEKNLGGTIVDFRFRDKTKGWGCTAKATVKGQSGIKDKLIPCDLSSYYKLFLMSQIYRENCYFCKYASSHRPADLTIGDYWGIQQEHPELMANKGGILTEDKGISCIIINTRKGKKYIDAFKESLNIFDSTFEKVSKQNDQLNAPSRKGADREKILELYSSKGYGAVEDYFKKKTGIKIYYYRLKNMIPREMKKSMKKILGKV